MFCSGPAGLPARDVQSPEEPVAVSVPPAEISSPALRPSTTRPSSASLRFRVRSARNSFTTSAEPPIRNHMVVPIPSPKPSITYPRHSRSQCSGCQPKTKWPSVPATKAAVQSKVHRSDAKKSRRSKRVNSSVSPKIFQILPADHTSRCSPERSYLPRWSIFSRLKYFVPCTLRSIYETMK